MIDKVAVFHPGTQHSWQTAHALQTLGRLQFYATSIFYQPDHWPYRIERYLPLALARRAHAEFSRFSYPALDTTLVQTSGIAEWLERIARRAGYTRLGQRIDHWGNRRFADLLRRRMAEPARYAVWGYNSSSAAAFEAARDLGRPRILDRTIGDWRSYNRIMAEVEDYYGDFFVDHRSASQATIDRDDEEYALADVILAGSPFAAQTVRDHAADRDVAGRVRELNYCYDEALFGGQPAPLPRSPGEPLRFLFLGQAGPRKGIHLVLKVFEKIPTSAAKLTIVGQMQLPPAVFARYADRVEYRPTVPRAQVPALMRDSDVLLFPSYFEGAGIVLYEALASNVGLIQSANAAIAVTPETGILLPDISEDALMSAVMTAIEDRQRVEGWRAAGQAEAQRYTFARYRDGIAALLDELPAGG